MKKHKHKLVTISILITLTSLAIALINKFINASAILKNILHPDKGQYYDWRFGKIFYPREGTGKPILLIHDLTPASSSYEWNLIVDTLKKDRTVYTIDMLGCGRSDKPKITYTNFLYVQLITDFIKFIVKEPCDIIATGLSGSFVVGACKMNSNLFGKIMLINPEDLAVLNRVPTKNTKIAKFLLELPLIGTLVYNIIFARANVELLFTENYLFNPFHLNANDLDAYYESCHLGHGAGKYLLSSIKGNYIYLNVAHAVKEINNSVYIIGGSGQKGIKETIALYTSLNASFEYEIISRVSHLPQLEEPVKLLEQIRIFF